MQQIAQQPLPRNELGGKYFNVIGGNETLTVYSPVGHAAVLKSVTTGKNLACIQFMYGDSRTDLPLLVQLRNHQNRFQVLFPTTSSAKSEPRPFGIVITNLCKAGLVKIDLMKDDKPIDKVDDPERGINKINELNPLQSYFINADQTNGNKRLMTTVATKKKTPESKEETVSLANEDAAAPTEKVGDYFYVTVTCQTGIKDLEESFVQTMWSCPDCFVVEKGSNVGYRFGNVEPPIAAHFLDYHVQEEQLQAEQHRGNHLYRTARHFDGEARNVKLGNIQKCSAPMGARSAGTLSMPSMPSLSSVSSMFSNTVQSAASSLNSVFGSKSKTKINEEIYGGPEGCVCSEECDECDECESFNGSNSFSDQDKELKNNRLSEVAKKIEAVKKTMKKNIDPTKETSFCKLDECGQHNVKNYTDNIDTFDTIGNSSDLVDFSNVSNTSNAVVLPTSSAVTTQNKQSQQNQQNQQILNSKVAKVTYGDVVDVQSINTNLKYRFDLPSPTYQIGMSHIENFQLEAKEQLDSTVAAAVIAEYMSCLQKIKDNLYKAELEKMKVYATEECIVCMETISPTLVFFKCGHACVCGSECVMGMKNCPICRTVITAQITRSVAEAI